MNIKVKAKPNFSVSASQSSGQTLIETLVAVFILVMGVTAAIGLAIYAFSTSTNISKQIIAIGLAREGTEAIRNMRDTNWLKQASIDTDCYDFVTASSTGSCYRNWETQYHNFKPSSAPIAKRYPCGPGNADWCSDFYLKSDTTYSHFWCFREKDSTAPLGQQRRWGLDFNNGSGRFGLYSWGGPCNEDGTINGNPVTSGTSGFYRKVTVEEDSSGVFANSGVGPRLKVIARVWWTDKKCPASDDWPGNNKCSVQLESELTNWKDY